uniref:Uncharacterized protein n=1 Tax=Chenopodium quinoa TaxID=63459 RepID=A0A803KRC4_CHEQI
MIKVSVDGSTVELERKMPVVTMMCRLESELPPASLFVRTNEGAIEVPATQAEASTRSC